MSRSNPTPTNPAQHFFEWKGSEGDLRWYNKETEKEIKVKLPFEFLYLDSLNTIGGFSKQDKSSFWANEVRNLKEDRLYVKTKLGPFEDALYDGLTKTRAKGGKFAKSIYLAHKIGDEWVIGHIKAVGSSVSAWIDFTKKYSVETGKIIMTRGEAEDAPTGQFYPPVFTWVKATSEEDAVADKLDADLQAYLHQYLKAPKDEFTFENIEANEDTGRGATNEEKADFEQKADAASKERANKAAAKEMGVDLDDFDNKPVNLEDIPF